ncbi:MAG: hypothetical protein JWP59_5, partial [Massilia sp.]|nr:hypothetical protein [Massilia sp.]
MIFETVQYRQCDRCSSVSEQTKDHVARLTAPPPVKGAYITGERLT